MENIKKLDLIDVVIEKVENKGKAVARIGQFVVFVNKGIPGQKLKVKVMKKKERYMETELVEVLEEAPNAIEAKCPWFGICGGCVWQTLPYKDQLIVKEGIVKDAIKHMARIDDENIVKTILPSPVEWNYRNKIELSFGEVRGREFVNSFSSITLPVPDSYPEEPKLIDLGFREKGSWTGILPVEVCHIFSEKFPAVVEVLRKWTEKSGKGYYDAKKNPDGYFQYCMIRKGEYTNEWMFNIITRVGNFPNKEELISELKNVLGDEVTSLYNTENSGGVGYAHHSDKTDILLYGKEQIMDHLGDLKFTISPFSFFQTNTKGAEILYDVVKKYVFEGDQTLVRSEKIKMLDLYCGTGTIGQYIAYGNDNIDIYGIEIVPQAIRDANKNAERNGIKNVNYVCGDARKVLKEQKDFYGTMDVVVVDPPRSGMAPKALQRALDLGAEKFIYVSCNPATLSRDIVFIHENSDYRIKEVQPVDMFPHTSHVECVAEFEIANC